MTLLLAFVLQLIFLGIVLGGGYTVANRIGSRFGGGLKWIDRLCVAAVVAVVALACLGLVMALVPWSYRQWVAAVGLSFLTGSSAYLFIKRHYYRDIRDASAPERTFLVGYVLLCLLGTFVSCLPVKLPESLVDGPYVNKQNVLGVRVQYITGDLPGDNSLPHVVSEYLLRGISFKAERPILPGQEVSNRPILASLVILPFRAVVAMPAEQSGSLPRFNYVGTAWPDFRSLMQDDHAYVVSLSIGIALNALLMLALGAFAARLGAAAAIVSVCCVALMLTSPYFLFQTIFTWPKELAAFFVLFAFVAIRQLRSSSLAGLCLGLAYVSHPYAIAYFLAHVGWFLVLFAASCRGGAFLSGAGVAASERGSIEVARSGARMLACFVLVVLPWVLWSKFYLAIPSDLVQQNFYQPGQTRVDFAWIRLVNAFNLLLPGHLTSYPFDLVAMVRSSTVNVPGALGLVPFLFALRRLLARPIWLAPANAVYWVAPVVMLVAVFSNQAVPALHGLQGPIGLLLLIGVAELFRLESVRGSWLLLGAQLSVNVLFLYWYVVRLF